MLTLSADGTHPLILAFDTSSDQCSVAVHCSETLYSQSAPMIRGHSEALLPMISAALQNLGMTFAAIDRIAVGVGPGAFTGVRIGISGARALSLVLAKPAVGISNLDAVAACVGQQVLGQRSLVVATDTKRGDFYVAVYDCRFDRVLEPSVMSCEAIARYAPVVSTCVVAGDAAETVGAVLNAHGAVAEIAVHASDAKARMVAVCASAAWPFARIIVPPRPQYMRGPMTGVRKTPIRAAG